VSAKGNHKSRAIGERRRIVLLVEGESEAGVIGNWFQRWIVAQNVGPHPVGITARNMGGVDRYLTDLGSVVDQYLSEHRAQFLVGIVDLYGLPKTRLSLPGSLTVPALVNRATESIERLVSARCRSRFAQHFAVLEFEAWLLAYPEQWPLAVRSRVTGRAPESINFDEPPSKLLRKVLSSSFRKTVDARRILAKVDLSVAIAKCPFLKQLSDHLISLAPRLQ